VRVEEARPESGERGWWGRIAWGRKKGGEAQGGSGRWVLELREEDGAKMGLVEAGWKAEAGRAWWVLVEGGCCVAEGVEVGWGADTQEGRSGEGPSRKWVGNEVRGV